MSAAESDPRTAQRISWIARLLLISVVLVQLMAGAHSAVRFLGLVPAVWVREAESPLNPLRSAVRVLPQIAARIPDDASVLLITPVLERIPFEFHFLPEEFHRLIVFPESWIALLEQRDPYFAWHGSQVRARWAENGQLWSPARFAEVLKKVDFVVTFFFADPVMDGHGLRLVSRIEQTTLYAVER